MVTSIFSFLFVFPLLQTISIIWAIFYLFPGDAFDVEGWEFLWTGKELTFDLTIPGLNNPEEQSFMKRMGKEENVDYFWNALKSQ